jgi:hypothetical protein
MAGAARLGCNRKIEGGGMSELSFEQLGAAFDRDMDLALARRNAVQAVSELVEELDALGFAPLTSCLKNDASDGLIMVTLDLAKWKHSGEGDREPVQPDLPANDPSSPEPERESAERADEANTGASVGADPVPDNKVEPKQDPKPELITGPFSDEEKDLIVEMSVRGDKPAMIATFLDRPVGSINVMQRHLKARIEQAMQAKEAPETEPAAEVVPPAPIPSKLADVLSGPEREIDIHLNAVGYAGGWSPVRDLRMAEGLGQGDGASLVAEDLGVAKSTVVDRWRLINQDPTSIDHQRRLVRVLRLRAKGAVEAAE